MKSKYGFWKHGLNSLAGLAGLAGLVGLTGCKELSCDFSYSPNPPAAGAVVTFTNASVGADDYAWDFGDNTSSTTASPTHIYRKPGTYTVKLLIKRNKTEKRTRTQYITVIDTIPAIACNADTVYSFSTVQFTPQVYNPWKKNITYRWTLPKDMVVTAGKKLDSAAVVGYFTQYGQASQVELIVQLEGEVAHSLSYSFTPVHQSAPSVIYATSAHIAYEQYAYTINKQRVYKSSAITTSSVNLDLLSKEQDQIFFYGSQDTLHLKKDSVYFTIDTIRNWLRNKSIRGFQVDRLMSKVYAYSQDSLWVSNYQGMNKRCLAKGSMLAIKVDGDGNYLYWATSNGLYFHRLLKTKDNLETFAPDTVTTLYTNINKISVNSNLH